MSYRDPGTLTAPPPVLPRRRAWGLYAAVVGGVIVFLLVVTLGVYLGKMATALKQPLDKATVLAAMKDLPIFDQGVYNETQTKIQNRLVLPTLPETAQSATQNAIVYNTRSLPEYVVAWFDKEMQDRGYSIDSDSDDKTAPAALFAHRYQNGNDLVLVQAQRAPNRDETSYVVLRFTGYIGKG